MDPILIRTLRGERVERPPVWLMRQAGRYLTEYQELKARHSFLELCSNPELACEVTMQPIDILEPDAAILFSDILIPAQCLGIRVDFKPGPIVHNPLTPREITGLNVRPPQERVSFVFEAVRRIRETLELRAQIGERKALLGFAGAPWTMACYLLDQGPYKHFHGTQVTAYEHPDEVRQLLQILADLTADYLLEQLRSGADAVQLFDSWAGNLSLDDYRRWALPGTRTIVERIHSAGKQVILYVNGSAHLFEGMCESGADCLSVDWRTSLGFAQEFASAEQSIQGNFNPTHLFGPTSSVITRTRSMLHSVARRDGYIANLGHGVLQRTPRENVIAFVRTVQEGWTR